MSPPPSRAEVTGAMVAGARAQREGASVAVCPWSILSEDLRERVLAKAWAGGYSAAAPDLPDPEDAAPADADEDVQASA